LECIKERRLLLLVPGIAVAGIFVGLASVASPSASDAANVVRSTRGVVAVEMIDDASTKCPDYTHIEKGQTSACGLVLAHWT
jgi:hypothetical protein